ncbi:MAG: hypothetical protein GY838_11770 [bacterium]|nr:hypothetical protein [bacterium]
MRSGAPRPCSGRCTVLWGLALAVAFASVWYITHPARPVHPTGDLYDSLATARHLARGEGFLTDLAYPLSFAWDFARELPQPLLHRPPGFPLLLTIPYAAAGGDPERAVDAVRVFQLVLLTGLAWLGSTAWLRRGRPGAAAGWLVLLGANPLLVFAVDWGHVEMAAALVLLAMWLRRRGGTTGLTWHDGLGAGVLGLLRPELVIVPVVWWAADWRGRRPTLHSLTAPALAFLALTAPWTLRNTAVAGDPFFSIQAHAEHLKDTIHHPGYGIYLGLEPQSLVSTLADDPLPVLKKAGRGLRFFWREGHGLAPWLLLLVPLLGAALLVREKLHPPLEGDAKKIPDLAAGPGVVGLTLILLTVLYAVYDHSLRHLAVLVPIVLWETGPFLAELPAEFVLSWFGKADSRDRSLLERPWFLAPAAAVCASLLVWAMAEAPAGWDEAAAEAARRQPQVRQETERLLQAPPGPVFVKTSAAPWYADRPAVWDPDDDDVRATIRGYLGASTP